MQISSLDTTPKEHLLLDCTLSQFNGSSVKTISMVDTGGIGGDLFADIPFCANYNFQLDRLAQPRTLRVVDGRSSEAGAVTHTATFNLNINGHQEQITAFVTKLGQYDLILGLPWLRKHDPHISWSENFLSFDKSYCRTHCFPTNYHQICVHGTKRRVLPREPSVEDDVDDVDTPDITLPRLPRRIGAAAFHTAAKQDGCQVFSASLYEIEKLLESHGVDVSALEASGEKSSRRHKPPQPEIPAEDTDQTARQEYAAAAYLNGASLEDIRIALQDKKYINPASKLPQHLHDLLPSFDHKAADKLHPHNNADHKTNLKPGTTPPFGPLYNMSAPELQVLRKYLKEQLDKGFIRTSSSSAASPVLFAKKPGGGLRFCVDYRGLNAITIKNRYPLPLIQETLARLSEAKYFTKLNVIAAFNQIRIAEGDEWMTAFNTRYGLFETLVMPFGLCNAPATW